MKKLFVLVVLLYLLPSTAWYLDQDGVAGVLLGILGMLTYGQLLNFLREE